MTLNAPPSVSLMQPIQVANNKYDMTIAALPAFVSSRTTDNPAFVLGFSLGIVVVLSILFTSAAVYQHRKDKAAAAAEIQRQQQHAQVVNAAKDAHERTIAYACHQLRNPLQSIVGSISFLKEQFANNESCREDITAIAGAASDMSRVIDDISDWVKVSVGQLELKLEPVSLLSLLGSVVSGNGCHDLNLSDTVVSPVRL
jgi:signal transduction histidine kinase